MPHIFNHENIVNEKIIGPNCQNNYDQLQKQLDFHPFTILDKTCAFSFDFPSKDVLIIDYSCICNSIRLYEHYNCVCDYNSYIYDCTLLQLKWHIGLTQLYLWKSWFGH
jgi:hypothetical protein